MTEATFTLKVSDLLKADRGLLDLMRRIAGMLRTSINDGKTWNEDSSRQFRADAKAALAAWDAASKSSPDATLTFTAERQPEGHLDIVLDLDMGELSNLILERGREALELQHSKEDDR